jgi:hypothetical protein
LGDFCSVLATDGQPPGDYGCSVSGGTRHGCSVIPDQPNASGVAVCSVRRQGIQNPGDKVWCSIEGPGTKNFCSAVNPNGQAPAGSKNSCSVLNAEPYNGEVVRCSALLGGNGNRTYCSTLFAPGPEPKECSVLEFSDPNSAAECSVRPGQNAICSSLKQAPIGSCSVLADSPLPAHCSVIGGAGPNPGGICRP